MISEGGLLVALQKKVTVSYSTIVLLLGAETMTAASARGKRKIDKKNATNGQHRKVK